MSQVRISKYVSKLGVYFTVLIMRKFVFCIFNCTYYEKVCIFVFFASLA